MKLRRVKWRNQTGTKTGEGWFHQFIAINDGDSFIVPSAIVELDDGSVRVLEHIDGWYSLEFIEPYSEESS